MTRSIKFAVLNAALAALLAPAISAAANDGVALPIYPNTHKGGTAREPTNEKAVTQAVIHGDYRIPLHDRLASNRGPLVWGEATQVLRAEGDNREKYPIHLRHACGYDYAERRPDAHHTRTQTLVEWRRKGQFVGSTCARTSDTTSDQTPIGPQVPRNRKSLVPHSFGWWCQPHFSFFGAPPRVRMDLQSAAD